jgi:SAM-dependent methyltransferase
MTEPAQSGAPLKPLPDRWQQGDPYERYVGRWSRLVAPRFLAWLDLPQGLRWVDVGCGTGALAGAIVDACRPASVAGVEPSEGFAKSARASLPEHVQVHAGSATSMPLPTASVDVVVSGLVLNFVPDTAAGLAEMMRVTSPGGTVAAYVWDYAAGMELMRHFWDAAVALDPAAASLDEGRRFPLCRPEALVDRFAAAGLADVDVKAIDVDTRFASFDDYWTPFLGGQGPASTYAMSLPDDSRNALRDRLRDRLPIERDGSIALRARAWAVRATREAKP